MHLQRPDDVAIRKRREWQVRRQLEKAQVASAADRGLSVPQRATELHVTERAVR